MRAVVQRVAGAKVTVAGRTVSEIGSGLLVFVGVLQDDEPADAHYVAAKVRDLRVFEDAQGRMNRSLVETGGSALVVSQITICGDCRKGRRPSLDAAAAPDLARALYEEVVRELRQSGVEAREGAFQEHMVIELANDGPVTLLIDSKRCF
jgi:D-aminoacyl-tRNA deacylase